MSLAAVAPAQLPLANVIALVNVEGSFLSGVADLTVPLRAGPELSVAATKSFIASLTAVAHLVAEWTQDDELRAGLAALPDYELLELFRIPRAVLPRVSASSASA